MPLHNTLRVAAFIALNAAAALLALAVLSLLWQDYFSLALLGTLGVALLMEGRIQIAGRLPKTWIFWTHISAAIALVCTLTAILAWVPNEALIALSWFFAALTFSMGAVLWWQGLRLFFAAR